MAVVKTSSKLLEDRRQEENIGLVQQGGQPVQTQQEKRPNVLLPISSAPSTGVGSGGSISTPQDDTKQNAGLVTPFKSFSQPTSQAAGQPVGQPAVRPTRPKGSGAFVNFQRILEANRPQAQKLATDIGAKVIGTAEEDLRKAEQQSVESFRAAVDQPAISEDFFTNIARDPLATTQDPEALRRAQRILSGEFTGPTELGAASQARLATAREGVGEAAERLQTPGGLRQELSSLSSRFSPGRTAFDELLLSADPGARATIQGLGERLDPLVEQSRTRVQEQVGTIQSEEARQLQEEADRARGILTGSQQEFRTDLERRAKDAQNLALAKTSAIRKALVENQELTPDQLGLLGITREDFTLLRNDPNINIEDFLQSRTTGIDTQRFATTEEFNRSQALQSLLGEEPSFLTDPSLAGTADLDFTDFSNVEAQKARRALEAQRLGLPESAEFVPRIDIKNAKPGSAAFEREVQNQQERLRTKFNLPADADFTTGKTKNKQALLDQGYTEIAQLQIKNRKDQSIFVRAGPSGSLLPTGDIQSLFNRQTGETITRGDRALPVLADLQPQQGAPNAIPRPSPVGAIGSSPDLRGTVTGEAASIGSIPETQNAINDALIRQGALPAGSLMNDSQRNEELARQQAAIDRVEAGVRA